MFSTYQPIYRLTIFGIKKTGESITQKFWGILKIFLNNQMMFSPNFKRLPGVSPKIKIWLSSPISNAYPPYSEEEWFITCFLFFLCLCLVENLEGCLISQEKIIHCPVAQVSIWKNLYLWANPNRHRTQ